ncbi:unnamed protein product, partial [marine sediment metagenome]
LDTNQGLRKKEIPIQLNYRRFLGNGKSRN